MERMKSTMKNSLRDLNNYLFEQLERIQDDELDDKEFEKEIARSKAVTNIAAQIIQNGNLVVKACQQAEEYQTSRGLIALNMIEDKEKK